MTIKKVIICDRCTELKDLEKRIANIDHMIADQTRKGYIASVSFLNDGLETMIGRQLELLSVSCSCKAVYQEGL